MNILIDKIIEFVKLKGDQIKVELIGKLAKFLAYVMTLMVIFFLLLLFFFFLSMAISEVLNHYLGSQYLGYFVVSGFFFVTILIFVILLRSGKMHQVFKEIIVDMNKKEDA
ncbi:MAG: phage holin family protein [Flammeovirgaceae bacterium]|nr:phage holin family protein [Flammeovirgaceae bacterium]